MAEAGFALPPAADVTPIGAPTGASISTGSFDLRIALGRLAQAFGHEDNSAVLAAQAGRGPQVRMIESGPAAGALVACYFSRIFGIPDLISFDMGGTTAKICLIRNQTPKTARVFEVARSYRFKKGSGMPISTPVAPSIS